jgi:hypothetical protein
MSQKCGESLTSLTAGKARSSLQGWVPELATPEEVRAALEKAVDYRGDVTLTLRNGERIEGYIFDRRFEGGGLDRCAVRLLPRNGNARLTVPCGEIVRLEFSGRDTAEGKSFEAWMRKYREKKALGEKDISLEPEALDPE